MAALIIIAGVGVFCWLLYGAAVYALPLFVGLSIGFHAEQAGASTLGAIVLGVGSAALVAVVGRVIFTLARSPILRIVIASIFAFPAALAGYFTTSTLFSLGVGWLAPAIRGPGRDRRGRDRLAPACRDGPVRSRGSSAPTRMAMEAGRVAPGIGHAPPISSSFVLSRSLLRRYRSRPNGTGSLHGIARAAARPRSSKPTAGASCNYRASRAESPCFHRP